MAVFGAVRFQGGGVDVAQELRHGLRVEQPPDAPANAEDARRGKSLADLFAESHKGEKMKAKGERQKAKGEKAAHPEYDSAPQNGGRPRLARRGVGLGLLLVSFCLLPFAFCLSARPALVLQSDFGVKDGAVAAMKGVAVGVDADLKIYDLTHEIPAFNIWEAAYRLWQTAPYWPAGTVFVSVVDPGVGTAGNRSSPARRTGNISSRPTTAR